MKYHHYVWKLKKLDSGKLELDEKIAFIKGKKKAWRYFEDLYMKSDKEIFLGLEFITQPFNRFFYCFYFPFRRGTTPKIAFQELEDYNKQFDPRPPVNEDDLI